MIALPEFQEDFQAFKYQDKPVTMKELNGKVAKFYKDNKITNNHTVFITGSPNSPFAFSAGTTFIFSKEFLTLYKMEIIQFTLET